MKPYLFKIYILVFALVLAISTGAQENMDGETKVKDFMAQYAIVISDSLEAHAEKLEVNMGGAGKNRKFQFGEFVIVLNDKGKTKTKTNENFFNTKVKTKSTRKFSFVLSDSKQLYANVSAEQNTVLKTQKNMVLGVIHAGDNQWVESDELTAWITINEDTSESWTLFMGNTGVLHTEDNYATFLSNGDRNIVLTPISGNKNFLNTIDLSARGYEFFENGQSLCAIQYFGIEYKEPAERVWIDRRLDAKTKLVLAAAMTVIFKTNK